MANWSRISFLSRFGCVPLASNSSGGLQTMSTEALRVCLSAFALGAAGMYAANRNLNAVRRRERWVKFMMYFVILNTVLLLAGLGPAVFGFFALALLIAGGRELSVAFAAAPTSAFSLRGPVWLGYGL